MSLRSRRGLRRAVVAAVAGLALSGCGVADDTARPGVAAQLGDTSIGLDEVDDAAANLCDMITVLAEEGATTAIPGSLVRDNSLQYVVLREFGEQLAEEYDVAVGAAYRGSLEQNEAQLTQLGVDGELLDEVLPQISSGDYFLDIVQQIGQRELGLSPEADTEQAGVSEGLRIAQEWENEQGLDVNPRFSDMHIGDTEQYVRTSKEDLSVAVGPFAKDALAAAEPGGTESSFAESLPESQRCG